MSEPFCDIYTYDETSPSCLRWKVSRCKARAGDVAGGKTKEGYFRVRNKKRKHLVHRVIWEMFYGEVPKGLVVDHINRDRSDNKISNLRLLNYEESAHNCRKKSSNTSGLTGVAYEGGEHPRWRATWMEGLRLKTKSFSVKKHGEAEAKRLATMHRDAMLENLKEKGVFYSEEHGL